jgi:hypothetical protein
MTVTACGPANKIIVSNGSGSICVGQAVNVSAGITIDAANVGGGDAEVYRDKLASILNFRTISGTGNIAVAENGDVIEIDGSGIPTGPVGLVNQLQYNNAGAWGGANLYWSGALLGFGGLTATDSAWKGVSTELVARQGDDNDYASVQTGALSINSAMDAKDNDINNVNSVRFDITPINGTEEGRLLWDEVEGTLSLGMPGGNVNLQIGQEFLTRAKNDEAVTINNGQLVYVNGASGNFPTVKLASNASILTAFIAGMATEDISSGAFGYITALGKVNGLDTSLYPPATVLWLGASGDITAIRPTPPTIATLVGAVVRQHATLGSVILAPTVVQRISWASDCNIHDSVLADGDIIWWDLANLRWDSASLSTLTGRLDHGGMLGLGDDDHTLYSLVDGTRAFTGAVTIEGSADTEQLIVQGHTTQSPSSPLIELRLWDGTPIGAMHTDNVSNIFLGVGAGYSSIAGSALRNTFIGNNSGYNTSQGDNNVGIGQGSLLGNITGAQNVAIGRNALLTANSTGNLAIGERAMEDQQNGSGNIAIGTTSMQLGTNSDNNVAIGFQAMIYNIVGDDSVAIGNQAGRGTTNASHYRNVFFGAESGYGIQTGTDNVVGGYQAAQSITTGSRNIILGSGVDVSAAGVNDELNIGNAIKGDLSTGDVAVTASLTVGSADEISWSSRSEISSPADGTILLTDAAGTDFGLLQFGGSTSSYPAIKRIGAYLSIRLSDDSADANLVGKTITGNNAITSPEMRADATGVHNWSGRSEMTSPIDGNILLTDAAGTSFNLLQFGGTTSSFPALKRVATTIQSKLADDSALADFQAANIFGSSIRAGGSSMFYWNGRSEITSPADGDVLLTDAAGTSFGLLAFGGITSSYPAIKRNGAGVDVVTADDLGYANLAVEDIDINGALNHDGSTVGFYGTTPVVQSAAYTPTNVSTDRSYDANSTTVSELADVLGTLIADLQATGIIG